MTMPRPRKWRYQLAGRPTLHDIVADEVTFAHERVTFYAWVPDKVEAQAFPTGTRMVDGHWSRILESFPSSEVLSLRDVTSEVPDA